MTFEEHLSIAAGRVASNIANSLPDEKECTHVFSEQFEKNMHDFIDQWGQKKKHPILRKVLLAAAAILLAFGILMAASPAVRAAVTGWFSNLYENFTVYRFRGTSSYGTEQEDSGEMPQYELTWMPEGYELSEHIDQGLMIMDIYLNDSQQMLTLMYMLGDSGVAAYIDLENAKMEKVLVGKIEAEFYKQEAGDSNTLIWQEEDSQVLFVVDAFEDKETLIKIANGIHLIR